MAATDLAATRTRVAMVYPPRATVQIAIADLRATTSDAAELVDQVHYGEWVRVLGSRGEWRYVQAEDHYFGWVRARALNVVLAVPQWRVVAVPLAAVRREPDVTSDTLGVLPAGAPLAQEHPSAAAPWVPAAIAGAMGYVSFDDTVVIEDLPQRAPTADDLLATAEAFLGVPYLWGGTTALGIDCSGFVQQVYRLNGIRLDRDADQQAMEGRAVEVPAPGDLIFFGTGKVTHVALATGERGFIHAPQTGAHVERGELSAARRVLAVRRYLP